MLSEGFLLSVETESGWPWIAWGKEVWILSSPTHQSTLSQTDHTSSRQISSFPFLLDLRTSLLPLSKTGVFRISSLVDLTMTPFLQTSSGFADTCGWSRLDLTGLIFQVHFELAPPVFSVSYKIFYSCYYKQMFNTWYHRSFFFNRRTTVWSCLWWFLVSSHDFLALGDIVLTTNKTHCIIEGGEERHSEIRIESIIGMIFLKREGKSIY